MDKELEKKITQISLDLYKLSNEINEINQTETIEFYQRKIIEIQSKINKIDKKLLKETGIKFPDTMKETILNFIK